MAENREQKSDHSGSPLYDAMYDVLVDEERGDFSAEPGIKAERGLVAAALAAEAEKLEGDEVRRLRAENERLREALALIADEANMIRRAPVTEERYVDVGYPARIAKSALQTDEQRLATSCGRLLVGQGDDTYDPECVLPADHDGLCKPEVTQ